nr:hypothetical protein [Tanacetum cinerariifolium]
TVPYGVINSRMLYGLSGQLSKLLLVVNHTDPFTIAEVYPYGTAKLVHVDGSNFKSIRVKGGRPIEIKGIASWDLDIGTWGCWGECVGVIWWDEGVREKAWGRRVNSVDFGRKSCWRFVRLGWDFGNGP